MRNSVSGIGYYLYRAGDFGMSAVAPAITTGVAYFIADRPGIVPGLILGFIYIETKTDFIGGIVAGSLVGCLALAVRKYVKLLKATQGLVPVMVIPVLVTATASVLMFTVMGQPFAWLQITLTETISSLQSGPKSAFGAVLGGVACFDFGDPMSKTMSTFVNGFMIDGVIEPEAVKLMGSITPPFGITISCLLTRNKYTRAEKEALKAAVSMGFCMITESVIPIATRDLTRAVFSCVYGSAAVNGLFVIQGCGSLVPRGGMLSVSLFTNPAKFCFALAIGNVITGTILSLIKKPVIEDDESFEDLGNVVDTAGDDDGGDIKIETF